MSRFLQNMFRIGLPLLALCVPVIAQEGASIGEDRVNTLVAAKGTTVLELQSTIIGNQEQPEVITIVPWHQIDAPAPAYQPMQAIVDDKFELLDRDEWRRKIQLNKTLSSRPNDSSAKSP